MRRKRIFIAGLILCCVAAFGFTRLVRQSAIANSSGPAFVITLVEKRYDASGKEIYNENVLRAYSSNGFVDVIQRKDPNGNPAELKTIVSLSAAKRIVLDPLTDSKTTYALTPGDVRAYISMETDCARGSEAESATVAGYRAVKKVMRIPDNSRPVTWEIWQSPELRCYPLRFRALEEISGKVLATRDVAFVVRGEPPAYLFEEIPANYVERSPAGVFAEFERRFPGQRGSSAETSQLLDDVYRKRP